MKRMTYAVEQRLRFIDFLFSIYGYANPVALTDYFGISVPQASADIAAYSRMAPSNIFYDAAAKYYYATSMFKRVYP